jgi:hypothetical protein
MSSDLYGELTDAGRTALEIVRRQLDVDVTLRHTGDRFTVRLRLPRSSGSAATAG